MWLLVPPHAVQMAYWVLPINNLMGGIGGAAMGVAISAMIYKTSRPEGRSVQFAAYSVFLALVGAPMPLVGAWIVEHAGRIYPGADLRITFYLWSVFMLLAALAATRLKEPDSASVRALVREFFPSPVIRLLDAMIALLPFPAWYESLLVLTRKRSPEEAPESAPAPGQPARTDPPARKDAADGEEE